MTQPQQAIAAAARLASFVALALVSFILFASFAAAEDFQFGPAYPSITLKGAPAAKGAVIWSHGINSILGKEGAAALPPMFIGLFRDDASSCS